MSINIQQALRKCASLINHPPQPYVGDLPTRPLATEPLPQRQHVPNKSRIGRTSQSSKTVSFLFRVVILLTLLITILLVNHQTQYQGHAAGSTATVQPVGQTGGWNMIFDDEFNGTSLDLTKWQPNWLGSSDTAITRPVNGSEYSCYDPKQVSEGNGELDLTAAARSCNGYNYASGLIESNGKFNFTYMYMEARIWTPAGTGMWPGFWSDGQNWPQDGETDVLEADGTDNSSYHYHYAGCGGNCGPGGSVVVPGATTGWHTYAADWEPGIITWSYDGQQVWQYTTSITSSPMFLIVNFGLSSNQSAVPATMRVDYVRVWQRCTTNCVLSTPTPTLPATSTSTPTPIPTNTPIPTVTPTPTPTLTPILTNTPTPTPTSQQILDTTPPTVTITSPLNGSTVKRRSTVTITASASDNVGVTRVSYTINGSLLCTTTVSPYVCSWSVPGKLNASYTITAKAYDAAGNTSTNTVTVTAKVSSSNMYSKHDRRKRPHRLPQLSDLNTYFLATTKYQT